MTDATIDLRTTVANPPVINTAARRARTALWCTGIASALGAGGAGLLVRDVIDGHPTARFIAAGAALLAVIAFSHIAYITSSTANAVGDLKKADDARAARVIRETSAEIAARFHGEIDRAVDARVADPLKQIHAEFGRVLAILEGRALDPEDPALPQGLRGKSRPYAGAAAVVGPRFDAIAEDQKQLKTTVELMGSELAKMRIAAEQIQSAQGHGAVQQLADAIMARVDERIEARLDDVRTLAENDTKLNGHEKGNVVGWPLKPQQ